MAAIGKINSIMTRWLRCDSQWRDQFTSEQYQKWWLPIRKVCVVSQGFRWSISQLVKRVG